MGVNNRQICRQPATITHKTKENETSSVVGKAKTHQTHTHTHTDTTHTHTHTHTQKRCLKTTQKG